MIVYETGDILQSNAEALVNPVNCKGVMGRGLAYEFKLAYPKNFEAYVTACAQGALRPGQLFIQRTGNYTKPNFIVNFPTKVAWWQPSKLSYIEQGLKQLVGWVMLQGVRSLAVPALGCGLGGLNWTQVEPLIRRELSLVPRSVVKVYVPREQEEVPVVAAPPSSRTKKKVS